MSESLKTYDKELYEAINENNNAISAWNNCIKNTKDKNLIREAKIHLDHLLGY